MNREEIKNILDKTNISVVDEIHILEYIEQLEQIREEYTKSLDKLDESDNRLDKAIEYIEKEPIDDEIEYTTRLLDILRGEDNE